MAYYYFFFLLFGFFAMFDYLKSDSNTKLIKQVFIVGGFILQVFFVGFRYKIASDWTVYMEFYKNSPLLDDILRGDNLSYTTDFIEPGFKLLMSLFKTLNLDYHYMVFTITVFNTTSLYLYIYRNDLQNKFTFLSITLILYLFRDFDILRQSLAFNIMLFAFSKNRINTFKYFSLVAAAMCFHYSAIIYVFFFFFRKIRVTSSIIGIVFCLFLVSLFITVPIISSMLNLFGNSTLSVVAKAQGLVQAFAFQKDISFTSVLNLLFLGMLLNYSRRNDINDLAQSEQDLIKFFLFYVVIYVLFKEIQEVADRMAYYFVIGSAFIFSFLTRLIKFKEIKRFAMIVPFCFILLRLYMHFNNDARRYGFVPYKNFLFIDYRDEIDISINRQKMEAFKTAEDEEKKN